MLEFRVLGPLDVRRDGRLVDVRGGKRRALLALLVLQANETVRTHRLIQDLWGEEQPTNAAAALQSHVSRLRKDLGEDVLVTKPWGYVLRAPAEAVDLHRFEHLVAVARALPAREREAKLARALSLWHGSALSDLAHEPALAVEAARLDELRLSVLEQQIDAKLELGEHEQAVPDLERLIAEHPLRERLRGQLILALYRSGRQAEALETYRETRSLLVDELGIEPGPELRELEQAILRQDPALASKRAEPARASEESRPPASRWRWPRSPLMIGAAVLLMLAGAAVAVLAAPRKGTPHASAAQPPAASDATTTRPPPSPTVSVAKNKGTVAPAHTTPARPRHQSVRPHPSAKATTTTTTTSSKQTTAGHPPPTQLSSSARPRPPPPTPIAPPPGPSVRIADSFDGGSIDDALWSPQVVGTGASVVEQNGRLEFALSADAAADQSAKGFKMVSSGVSATCRFPGDFDVHVTYELLDWPEANGVVLQLGATFAAVARRSMRWDEEYVVGRGSQGTRVRTADRRGSLRIRRVGSQLSSYVLRNGHWIRIAYWGASGVAGIALQAYSTDYWFAHQPVTAAFDDFEILADGPVC